MYRRALLVLHIHPDCCLTSYGSAAQSKLSLDIILHRNTSKYECWCEIDSSKDKCDYFGCWQASAGVMIINYYVSYKHQDINTNAYFACSTRISWHSKYDDILSIFLI